MHWRLKSLTTGSAIVCWGSDSTCQRVSNEYFWEKSLKNTIWLQVQCHEILKYRLLLLASSQPLLLFYSSFCVRKNSAESYSHSVESYSYSVESYSYSAESYSYSAESYSYSTESYSYSVESDSVHCYSMEWDSAHCYTVAWSETLR